MTATDGVKISVDSGAATKSTEKQQGHHHMGGLLLTRGH